MSPTHTEEALLNTHSPKSYIHLHLYTFMNTGGGVDGRRSAELHENRNTKVITTTPSVLSEAHFPKILLHYRNKNASSLPSTVLFFFFFFNVLNFTFF